MKTMGKICMCFATLLVINVSCSKNEHTSSPESVVQLKKYQLSVPLEDGRKFIETKVQPTVQLIKQQTPAWSGFAQIQVPDEAYRNVTTLMRIKNPGDFSIINCIADHLLKVTFTDSVRRMPGYPTGWTAVWNTRPNVEQEAPTVLYTMQQNRLTLQLSKYVSTFGFELAPNLYEAYPFNVGFYDSKENPPVASLQQVATTPAGAKLFAVNSVRPFNVIEIAYAGEGGNTGNPYGFAIANIRYKLVR